MDKSALSANACLVRLTTTSAAALLLAWLVPTVARAATPCANLSAPPGSTLAIPEIVTGSFTPPGSFQITGLPTFCRVQATLRPTPQSNIRVELWMPVSGWNGRLLGTGNGGYGGSIVYDLPSPQIALAGGVKQGYAVVNTDLGTSPSTITNADALIGQTEKQTDYGSRATHEMTVFAKQVITQFYGLAPNRSYFSGCSTAGNGA